MTYKTISQRENITDPDISRILDYLERHDLSFKKHEGSQYKFSGCMIEFYDDFCDIRDPLFRSIISIPIDLLAQTISQVYQNLKKKYG